MAYAQARRIPLDHVISLTLPEDVGAQLSPEAFAPLYESLSASLPQGIEGMVIAWTEPFRVGCMGVTSAFALGYDPRWCNSGTAPCSTTAALDYFDSSSVTPFADFGVRPAMLLAGQASADLEDLIRKYQ